MGIGKSNGLVHRLRPPTPCHPAAILPAAARAWGRPARPAPAAGQHWIRRRQAAGAQRSARTGGVAGDRQPARLERLGVAE